jgi:hypothetical protein
LAGKKKTTFAKLNREAKVPEPAPRQPRAQQRRPATRDDGGTDREGLRHGQLIAVVATSAWRTVFERVVAEWRQREQRLRGGKGSFLDEGTTRAERRLQREENESDGNDEHKPGHRA